MTYIPLARKWRPKCFAELVGQNHIVLPLQNALSQNKLHHAYLFTGTRGVGKTTVARIFAKALNCQSGVSIEPCLKCENCRAIDEGHFFDLIEVDGASRTRVEDTRELIENIQYAPTSGRFKIFIIDEVHMLSTHSFNALLKTLEEPPQHVKFLLATTDPQKIPATILSRCIQFNLLPLTENTIIEQLSHILKIENFPYELEALKLIANEAYGSMRDALTSCEQLMAVFPAGFKYQKLKHFIGASLEDYSLQLLDALCSQKISAILNICQQLAAQQISFSRLLQLFLTHFHTCVIQQIHPIQDCSNILKICSQTWSTQILHTLYLMTEKGLQDLDWAPNHAIGFEMLMLRMAQYIRMHVPEQILEISTPTPVMEAPTPVMEAPTPIMEAPTPVMEAPTPVMEAPTPVMEAPTPVMEAPTPVMEAPTPVMEAPTPIMEAPTPIMEAPTPVMEAPRISDSLTSPEEWHRIVTSLKIDGLGKSALNHSTFVQKNHDSMTLEIHKKNDSLFTPMIKQRIENAISEYFQHPIKIKLQYTSAETVAQTPAVIQEKNLAVEKAELEKNVHENPLIQRILIESKAEIIENSMTKLSNEL